MKVKGLKILSGVLIVLLIITVLITFTDNKKDRGNFKSEVISFSTSDITRVEIKSSRTEVPYSISKKSEGQWEVEHGNQRFAAQANLVDNLLYALANLKAKQVVAKRRDNWKQYSVNDSLGTRVRLYESSDLTADFVVGRMSFSQSRNPYQQYPDAVSYLRLAGEETVYAVEGMLTMNVNQDAEEFRNGDIIKCDPVNITRITFNYPGDSAFVLQKENEVWKINELTADSAHTKDYLNSLRNFSHREFEDIAFIKDQTPLFEMVVEGNNMEAMRIKAYFKKEGEYLVTSTLNKDTVFKFGSSQFVRLFKGKSWFI